MRVMARNWRFPLCLFLNVHSTDDLSPLTQTLESTSWWKPPFSINTLLWEIPVLSQKPLVLAVLLWGMTLMLYCGRVYQTNSTQWSLSWWLNKGRQISRYLISKYLANIIICKLWRMWRNSQLSAPIYQSWR